MAYFRASIGGGGYNFPFWEIEGNRTGVAAGGIPQQNIYNGNPKYIVFRYAASNNANYWSSNNPPIILCNFNPATMELTPSGQTYKSTDNGATWTLQTSGLSIIKETITNGYRVKVSSSLSTQSTRTYSFTWKYE